MKILGISGSPRKNGNTAFAVQYALEDLESRGLQTQYISLANTKINGCISCWKCSTEKKCIFDDDMTAIYEKIRWCDGIILGSPVYFGMVSGQLKTMMDRCVVFRPSYEMDPELGGKTGCGIACGGFRNGGQETTLQNIHTFLMQQNMKVINDGNPFSHAGATIVDEAEKDSLGLQTIKNLTANLVRMLK